MKERSILLVVAKMCRLLCLLSFVTLPLRTRPLELADTHENKCGESSGPQEVLDHQEDQSGRGEQAGSQGQNTRGQDDNQLAISDNKVSFLPESLALLGVIYGGAALIHYFKIDQLIGHYF